MIPKIKYNAILFFCLTIISNNCLANNFQIKNTESKSPLLDIAIIGGGPAGLSAGIQAGTDRLCAAIFAGGIIGGQLVEASEVENIPAIEKKSGQEIIDDLYAQAKKFGTFIIEKGVTQIDFQNYPFKITTEDDQSFYALSLIFATGAKANKLNIPGEDKYWGAGVSPCALCDRLFFQDQTVVIIGGGDDAAEKALQLAPYAKNILLFVRSNQMRASQYMQEKLHALDHLKIFYNMEVLEILGDDQKVEQVKVLNKSTNLSEYFDTDGVFIAIGHSPNTALLKDAVEFYSNGYVKLFNNCQATSREGIFAAGDVADYQYRQAVVAEAEGLKAAIDASRFLRQAGLDEQLKKSLKSKYYSTNAQNLESKS